MTQYCHILLIEDDDWLRQGLEQFLQQHQFQVSAVANLSEAHEILRSQQHQNTIHLLISDVSLPDGQALGLFDELNCQHQIGKIFISASVSKQDRIAGLQAGADDYLCKPVCPEELLLRIKALLRRMQFQREDKSEIRFLHYQLNPESRILSFDQQQVQLSNAEHQLLIQLLNNLYGHLVASTFLFRISDN